MIRMTLFLVLLCAAQGTPTIFSIAPTGSMKPLITENHYVLVEKRPFKDIKLGDIIVYRLDTPITYDGQLYDMVIHSVWRKSSGGRVVLCKGLANEVPDTQMITESHYVGVVTKIMTIEEYYRPGAVVAAPEFRLDSAAKP